VFFWKRGSFGLCINRCVHSFIILFKQSIIDLTNSGGGILKVI
jgi:hypothetical protein